MVPSSAAEPGDLLDLKLLPAWLKEPTDAKRFEHYHGEESHERTRDRRDSGQRFGKSRPPRRTEQKRETDRGSHPQRPQDRNRQPRQRKDRPRGDRPPVIQPKPLAVDVAFLPYAQALENVTAQIKSGSVAYSLFALARLFLEKPERYDVRLKSKPEAPLYQIGESGVLSSDRQFLENNAFRFAREDFYKSDITESEPIKGNFSNVARCKLSGTLLGPTNHHSYQARLRNLYEQRFSRRMSFTDYQRQIAIISDPAAVEQWKEEARKVTTFTTLREETPATFSSATETERHFRQNYLPALVRGVDEVTIRGVASRGLPDRTLHRAIEDAWVHETRSPSRMMQELTGHLREEGLHIFRHRRGMLFISPIRIRPFAREGVELSPTVRMILETVGASPGIKRKEFAEKVIVDLPGEEAEIRKRALASDLHWLISEGYVIEFNDNSLDLPRVKRPKSEAGPKKAELVEESGEPETVVTQDQPADLVEAPDQSPTTLSAGSASPPS
jgi:hypothetical protein